MVGDIGSELMKHQKSPEFEENSDKEIVPDTIFEGDDEEKRVADEKKEEKEMENSTDPFNIYSLLNRHKQEGKKENVTDSNLKYQPGFTPSGRNNGEDGSHMVEKVNDAQSNCCENPNVKGSGNGSISSGHFKVSEVPKTGGSMRDLLEEVVKVGQAKKDWVKELCNKNKVNFLAIQETKMEKMDEFCVKQCSGNLVFNHVYSEAVGNSGGILCVWDPNSFSKNNSTVSDYFVIVRGGCHFTWCHKSASKMSKLDRFLVSKSVISSCLNISAISLDRYLSDHRLILLKDNRYDYGPTPFQFFHHWRKDQTQLKKILEKIDSVIDSGKGNDVLIKSRLDTIHQIQNLDRIDALEISQKAKIKWAIDGPDGFSFGFFRHFWYLVDGEVYEVVRYFFTHFDLPKGCNSSFIALIPKIPDANMVKDFRPISLIGSIYKIIAKILTNRLVGVLGDIINEVQSAFIEDRHILDGPFILNKVFAWCKRKKKQTLLFKVDFEKAYDSVRLDFLDDILCKFGFGEKWQKWIQCCLNSSKGSIIINGSPTGEFQFGKGLKQGDPLSPFLFLLVMESLHISFKRVVDAGRPN
uniref:Cysteine-rich receptor-like protein kinase n=1 Tax=Tanacetum cinerariifolium TaxID=118510 RepID=A0A6L2JKR7_TANCI|nr:cysteine-rich receptor-like protein kinase [Tanacetum cinerariifolium]